MDDLTCLNETVPNKKINEIKFMMLTKLTVLYLLAATH